MKQLRLTLLGVVLALVLLAPAAASAAPTIVCTAPGTPCAAYVGPIGFELARTNNVNPEDTFLSFNGIVVRCTTIGENVHGPGGEGSDGMGSILVNPGNPVTGNVNSLWFFNCNDTISGTPCTVTTDAGAPLWPDAIDSTPLAPGSDGTLTVNFSMFTATCGATTCGFGPGAVKASWYNPGNPARKDTTGPDQAAAQFHFDNVTLPATTTACTAGTWRGNYAVRAGGDTYGGLDLWVLSAQ